jgi:hypothetical protein
MARFTRELRQKIIEEFARQNNGWYDPRAFVQHVRSAGPEHPAFEWFTWDDAAAAEAFRLDQARDFARGLVIRFEVQEARPKGKVIVAHREAPFAVSPVASRKSGGGYYLTDPTDAEHMAELRRQAASHLDWWLRRYGSAVEAAGGDVKAVEKVLALLQAEALAA